MQANGTVRAVINRVAIKLATLITNAPRLHLAFTKLVQRQVMIGCNATVVNAWTVKVAVFVTQAVNQRDGSECFFYRRGIRTVTRSISDPSQNIACFAAQGFGSPNVLAAILAKNRKFQKSNLKNVVSELFVFRCFDLFAIDHFARDI